MAETRRVWEADFGAYGVRKIRLRLAREGIAVARCTAARPMRATGPQGVVRGEAVRTTVSDGAAPCPLDRADRRFQTARPNALWVGDPTRVATWAGFVHVAFVIDAHARRIPRSGCARPGRRARAPQRPRVAIPRAALHRAPGRGRRRALGRRRRRLLWRRAGRDGHRPVQGRGDPPARAIAEGDPPEGQPAEWVEGRGFGAVELAALERLDRSNHRRPLGPIGNAPPAEAEARCCAQAEVQALSARVKPHSLRETRYGSPRGVPDRPSAVSSPSGLALESRRSGSPRCGGSRTPCCSGGPGPAGHSGWPCP